MHGTTDTGFNDDAHFTIGNIPFGIASRTDGKPQTSTRLRDQVYFLPELISHGLLPDIEEATVDALHQPQLNQLAALGRAAHRLLRSALQGLLSSSSGSQLSTCRAAHKDVTMHLPIYVGDFADFSCSLSHVLNASEAVTGVRSEPPGFRHFPIGYCGRASSVVASGTTIRRPLGQFRSADGGVTFGASRAVDFELEVACVIGKPSAFGAPISVEDAEEHMFGFVALNDWSARDIQGLEMAPLGPFNGKSFGTTISPWIVTVDALEPFKLPLGPREPAIADYLTGPGDKAQYAMTLQAELIPSGEPTTTSTTTKVCTSQLECLYWTFKDMVAHHTINGCGLQAGDLLATGTVSGDAVGAHGCLLEITKGSKQALKLAGGGERRYLQDGDAVRITGWAGELGGDDCVGFGDCVGVVAPSLQWRKR